MFALMTRAHKNVGDDLIHQRGRRILEHAAPGAPLVVANAFKSLAASLSEAEISGLQAIVVPGGPGARRDVAKIYPFLADAEARRIPVYFLGIGTRFFPGTRANAGTIFSDATIAQLRKITEHAPIGVRDYVTRQALRAYGVSAQLNGCPAWYSIPHLEQRPALPKTIGRIAFTTPADVLFFPQSIELLRRVRLALPSARVLIGFHHGIASDDPKVAEANQRMLAEGRSLGCEHVDLSGSSDKLAIYEDCDLHIGYRVHAHIFFMSLRKPSFLVAEDSRGVGVLQALGGVGTTAWNALADVELSRRLLQRARAELLARPDAEIAEWLDLALARELDLGFPHVETAARIIDQTFRERMLPFAQNIFAAAK